MPSIVISRPRFIVAWLATLPGTTIGGCWQSWSVIPTPGPSSSRRSASGGQASHAYLFYGPGGAGKRAAARAVAAELLAVELAEIRIPRGPESFSGAPIPT